MAAVTDSTDPQDQPSRTSRVTTSGMRLAEDVIYAAVALVLIVAAVILVGESAVRLVRELREDAQAAVQAALESLLIVFILVELLGALRATLSERRLVAEPFLLVGIIATIKEIVVGTVEANDLMSDPPMFRMAMLKIGVLSGLLLALGVTTLLVRRKEREPEE